MLLEKFYTGYNAGTGYFEVYINPTEEELYSSGDGCRGIVDKEGNLYIAQDLNEEHPTIHNDLLHALRIKEIENYFGIDMDAIDKDSKEFKEINQNVYYKYKYENEDELICVQRVNDTNYFALGESYPFYYRRREATEDMVLMRAEKYLELAHKKNPNIFFIPDQYAHEMSEEILNNLINECIELDMIEEALILMEDYGQGSIGSAYKLFKKISLDFGYIDNNTSEKEIEFAFDSFIELLKDRAYITTEGYYPWIVKNIVAMIGGGILHNFYNIETQGSGKEFYINKLLAYCERVIKFNLFKNKSWFIWNKDINLYKDFKSLQDVIADAEEKNEKIEEEKREKKQAQSLTPEILNSREDIVAWVQNHRFTMMTLSPEDKGYKCAKDYGADTWCWYNDISYFQSYSNDGWLIIIKDNSPKKTLIDGTEQQNSLATFGIQINLNGEVQEVEDKRNKRDIDNDLFFEYLSYNEEDKGKELFDELVKKTMELPRYKSLRDGYKILTKKRKSALVSPDGKQLTEIKYDSIDDYTKFAKVRLNNKFGIINKEGKEMTPIKYDKIIIILGGFIIVIIKEKEGLLNEEGKEITPIKYEKITDFKNGFSKVVLNGQIGYIDEDGKEITPIIYDRAKDFMGAGFAEVAINADVKWGEPRKYKWGIINRDGKEFGKGVVYDEINIIPEDKIIKLKLDNKTGIIDFNNKEIVSLKYNNVFELEHGFRIVKLDGKFGAITEDGEEIVPPIYDEIINNNIYFTVTKDRREGLIGIDGKEITPIKYEIIMPFEDGFAKARTNNKWVKIDIEGKEHS